MGSGGATYAYPGRAKGLRSRVASHTRGCPGFDGGLRDEFACKGLFRTSPHGATTKANDNNVGEFQALKVAA